MLEKIHQTTDFLQAATDVHPTVGLVMGSGLGGLSKDIIIEKSFSYKTIPNFPVSTVAGHVGELIFGTLSGKSVVAMKGRFHYYEGYSMQEVTFPIRVMKALGVKTLILSNAAGGLHHDYHIADIMFIEDHINLMGDNPLMGVNDDELGPRFPDMSEVYTKSLLEKAISIGRRLSIPFHTGIYTAVSGPVYETPAEYRNMRIIGADAVGMSVVPEAIVARQSGMELFAFSLITDLGVDGKIKEVSHDEVIKAAESREPDTRKLVATLVETL
jgi:purine-nucleoside phosphorylase